MRKFFVINVPEVLGEQRLLSQPSSDCFIEFFTVCLWTFNFPAGLFAFAPLG